MQIKRKIETKFKVLMQQYPVVTITGPRQSGKTTLARSCYPNKNYYNLEAPDIFEQITSDPRGFFANNPKGAILDEIQNAPELMSYIQTIVDEEQIMGQFILTGSHQLQLHQAITQSLAGRNALLELLPLSLDELKSQQLILNQDQQMFKGFYPGIYKRDLQPTEAYRNYIKTYIERDIRQIINIQNLNLFQRFLKLISARVGNLLNVESLANDVGASHNTIKNWLSILNASYLTYTLQPYFENFGKRIIKSPKLYFNDVGMVCYLLDMHSPEEIARDRLRGALFENMVLLDLIKFQFNRGRDANMYFYRDSHGTEIDIILKIRDFLIPIEIKSTQTYNTSLLKNLHKFQKLVGERAPVGFLIYAGDIEQPIKDIHLLNYQNASSLFNIIQEVIG